MQTKASPSQPIGATHRKHRSAHREIRGRTSSTFSPPSPPPPSSALLLQRPRQPPLPTSRRTTTTNDVPEGGGGPGVDVSDTSSVADVLRLMDCLQLPVEADTYATLLKECTDSLDLDGGSAVHAHLRRRRLEGHDLLLLDKRLMLMYLACGRPDCARSVFDGMSVRDSISWATMVSGHSNNNEHRCALRLFVKMVEDGSLVTGETTGVICVVVALQSCAGVGDIGFGRCVHGLVLKNYGCRIKRLVDSLIEFYGMTGDTESARLVFEHMSSHNSASWSAMIYLYYRRHTYKEVVEVFKEMKEAGKTNTCLVLSTVLKACGHMPDDGEHHGRQAHASVVKAGLESVQSLQCSMIEMYGRLGLIQEARKVFDMSSSSQRDATCWYEMLNAYTRKGCFMEAVRLLYEMKAAGIELQQSMLNQVRLVC